MRTIYKIMPAVDWRDFQAAGGYDGSADDQRDGFIHLSSADQLRGTLAKYYAGQTGLVLLQLDTAVLGADLRWEPSRGGMLFPHFYGPLDLVQISAHWLLPDTHQLPEGL